MWRKNKFILTGSIELLTAQFSPLLFPELNPMQLIILPVWSLLVFKRHKRFFCPCPIGWCCSVLSLTSRHFCEITDKSLLLQEPELAFSAWVLLLHSVPCGRKCGQDITAPHRKSGWNGTKPMHTLSVRSSMLIFSLAFLFKNTFYNYKHISVCL